jgi:O-antigen/teichoic acid export membrane protein
MLDMLESKTDELVPETPIKSAPEQKMEGVNSATRRGFTLPSASKLFSLIYSVLDQGLAVGGGLLANVMLARAQTKEEYGKFVLSYALFSLILGLYQAVLLEPYTVYGSGRYREIFSGFSRLMVRTNVILAVGVTIVLLASCVVLRWLAPHFVTGALWGLALTAGILLSGYLLRRVFYLKRQAGFAAGTSTIFFVTVAIGLWMGSKYHYLSGFAVFLTLALGWIVAGLAFGPRLALEKPNLSFLETEPTYWTEHWRYSRWVLATAIVYQFTTQGYYWLVAGFLSAKEVADIRVMYLLVSPTDQLFIAMSLIPALSARYAAKDMKSFFSTWKKFVFFILFVTITFAIGVRVAGKAVMHLLYAGKYDGLVSYLLVLALYPILTGLGSALTGAVIATEKPKLVFLAYLSGACVTFLAGILLVKYFGLWGAVYGMLLSAGTFSLALGIAYFVQVHRRLGLATASTRA